MVPSMRHTNLTQQNPNVASKAIDAVPHIVVAKHFDTLAMRASTRLILNFGDAHGRS